MSKPRLLDLCCKAGGASVGYARAGFEVVGVDIERQPNYPFKFVQADALTFDLSGYHAVHASPDCRGYSKTRSIHGLEYPQQIPDFRRLLSTFDGPWVIENVEDAPLEGIKLCGTQFGLRVIRHRLFESNCLLFGPGGKCKHKGTVKNGDYVTVAGHCFTVQEGHEAMGVDWKMTKDELAKSIHPLLPSGSVASWWRC